MGATDIHIIFHRNKWKAKKHGSKRALQSFKYRELAFLHACNIGGKIIVHNKDGTVLFAHQSHSKVLTITE